MQKNNAFTDKNFLKYIIGLTIGVAATLISMFAFSALILVLNLDRQFAAPLATLSVAVGCFLSAYYTAKKRGDRGYLVGLIIGAVSFVLITIISFIIGGSHLSYNTLFHFIICILASAIGGILGVNKGKNKKYI